MYKSNFSLHNADGQRKYLNQIERTRFLACTENYRLEIKLFAQLLYYTGARIAEIHNLMTNHIDFSNRSVVIETLKKRKRGVFREIPLPDFLLENLELHIKDLCIKNENSSRLWYFSLRTASRYIKIIMLKAGISGIRASAKSLRHGYAVNAVQKAPITLVKKWLGHGSIETTAIYLNIVGIEERKIAETVWMY